jgi:hypothetical protein
MNKIVCFLNTDISGEHSSDIDEEMTKKDIYKLGRMASLNYMVGQYKDKVFTEIIHIDTQVSHIWLGGESENTPNVLLSNMKQHLSTVNIIIGYDVNYHIKSIISEALRYNIYIDFTKFILINLKTFNNNYETNNIKELYDILNDKKDIVLDEIQMLICCFNKLYMKLVKTLSI